MYHVQRTAGSRVLSNVSRAAIAIGVAAAALAAWYLARGTSATADDAAADDQRGAAASSDRARPANAPPPPPTHVVKLAGADERRAIAERIDAAQTARAAIHARRPLPALPAAPQDVDPNDMQSFARSFRAAMREAVPILAECFSAARARHEIDSSLSVTAKMTVVGDPDVGALIDAHELESASPISHELDACLRDTFQKLELPAPAGGGKIDVTYPLVFRDE